MDIPTSSVAAATPATTATAATDANAASVSTEHQIISYNLGKKYRKLTFGVGIEDNSATREQVAVFILIADGKPIFEKTAQKNEPVTSQLVWMTPQLHS